MGSKCLGDESLAESTGIQITEVAKPTETAVGTVEEAAEAKPAETVVNIVMPKPSMETPGNEEEELDEDARWHKMVTACTYAAEGWCNCRKCLGHHPIMPPSAQEMQLPEIISPFVGGGSRAESTGMRIAEVFPLSDESFAESIGIQITEVLPEMLGSNLGAGSIAGSTGIQKL